MNRLEQEVEPPLSSSRAADAPSSGDAPEGRLAPIALGPQERGRLRSMFDAHYDSIWRLLRRFGLDTAAADDATQQVFIVAMRRLSSIEADKERSFLCGTAVRVASAARAESRRRREDSLDAGPGEPERAPESGRADELLDRKRRRELLDGLLAQMDEELRVVLVLAELEGLGKREIAACLAIPEGTAASRLRRAREDFKARLDRHLARSGR